MGSHMMRNANCALDVSEIQEQSYDDHVDESYPNGGAYMYDNH